ncbi:MAG: NAD-dependent epimerase/dehydratase family protein [Chloroflexi bacterium]|nr:NAD-dependent epimerase/dehydratase family protein [Chloroflexota bacterium]
MILITGGMGFIGLHTARRFLDAGESVVITQYVQRREPEFIKDEFGKRVFVERLDVTSTHDVIEVTRKHKVTGIVDLVAPGLGALSPAEDFRVNMMCLINLLEAARVNDVPRVTLGSSVAVYAGLPAGPFREDALLPLPSHNPTETYKKSWEIIASHYAERTGLEVVAARLSGIYGPLYHSMSNLPSRLVHAALKDESPALRGEFEDDASDMCYVKDCAMGLQMIQMADHLPHRVYNIGAGVGRSNRELVHAVQQVVPTAEVSLQPGHSPRARPDSYEDITRATADVGYKPEWPIERAVGDYIGWLRDHPV